MRRRTLRERMAIEEYIQALRDWRYGRIGNTALIARADEIRRKYSRGRVGA